MGMLAQIAYAQSLICVSMVVRVLNSIVARNTISRLMAGSWEAPHSSSPAIVRVVASGLATRSGQQTVAARLGSADLPF